MLHIIKFTSHLSLQWEDMISLEGKEKHSIQFISTQVFLCSYMGFGNNGLKWKGKKKKFIINSFEGN